MSAILVGLVVVGASQSMQLVLFVGPAAHQLLVLNYHAHSSRFVFRTHEAVVVLRLRSLESAEVDGGVLAASDNFYQAFPERQRHLCKLLLQSQP